MIVYEVVVEEATVSLRPNSVSLTTSPYDAMVIVGSEGDACHEMVTDVLLIKVTRRFVGGAGTGRAAWERECGVFVEHFMSLTNKFCIVKAVHKHLSTRTIEIEKHEREKAGMFPAVKFMIISKGRVQQLLFVKEWNRRCC